MPEFPGGVSEMMKFLSKNTNYPKQAREDGIVGKAIVSFVVDSAGNVVKTKIEQASGNTLLDIEALRVVSIMPRWKPGSQNGKDVPVKITVPMIFDLDNMLATFLKQKGDLANKYYNDGVNYFGSGQLQQAKQSFLNALNLNTYDTDSKYNLAATYLKLNQKIVLVIIGIY